jgi:hypothetical protein
MFPCVMPIFVSVRIYHLPDPTQVFQDVTAIVSSLIWLFSIAVNSHFAYLLIMGWSMKLRQLVEWELGGETKLLGETLLPMQLCSPKIPDDLISDRIRAAQMGRRHQLLLWSGHVTPCSVAYVSCRLHLQRWIVSRASNKQQGCSKQSWTRDT